MGTAAVEGTAACSPEWRRPSACTWQPLTWHKEKTKKRGGTDWDSPQECSGFLLAWLREINTQLKSRGTGVSSTNEHWSMLTRVNTGRVLCYHFIISQVFFNMWLFCERQSARSTANMQNTLSQFADVTGSKSKKTEMWVFDLDKQIYLPVTSF